jgi:hypothetical protein
MHFVFISPSLGSEIEFNEFLRMYERLLVRKTSVVSCTALKFLCIALHLTSQGAQPVKHIVDTPLVLGSVCNPWFLVYPLPQPLIFLCPHTSPRDSLLRWTCPRPSQLPQAPQCSHQVIYENAVSLFIHSTNTITVPSPATSTRPSLVPAQTPRVSVPDITPAATPPQPAKPLTHANVALADEQTRKPSSTFLTADLTDDDDTVVEEVIEDVVDEVPSERSQHSTASEKLDRGIVACLNLFYLWQTRRAFQTTNAYLR